MTASAPRRSARRRQHGQVLIAAALALLLLVAVTAIEADGSAAQYDVVQTQVAADAAALAGSDAWLLDPLYVDQTSKPTSTTDAAVEAARRFGSLNGVSTDRDYHCIGHPAAYYRVVFYDVPYDGPEAPYCTANYRPKGWTARIMIIIPGQSYSVSHNDCDPASNDCVYVRTDKNHINGLGGLLGFPHTLVHANAVGTGDGLPSAPTDTSD